MLKQGKSILSFIRTESKISSEKITEIQHQANDLVYKNNMCYITPYTADTLFNKFVSLGTELSKEKVTDKQRPKKEEILEALRNNCRNLKRGTPIFAEKCRYNVRESVRSGRASRHNAVSCGKIFFRQEFT